MTNESVEFRVLFFARARDLTGLERLELSLPQPATVAQLKRELTSRFSPLAALLDYSAVSVNLAFATDSQVIPPGAEVAIIPPVSGG